MLKNKFQFIRIGTLLILALVASLFLVFHKQSRAENNNPLEVEFFICNTYDVHHMAPLAKELQNQGVLVTFFAKPTHTLFKSREKQHELEEHKKNVLNIVHEYGFPLQEQPNFNADVVLTTQIAHHVRNYQYMKVKIGYGATPKFNDTHQNPQHLEGFDGFLVHGQFEVDKYQHAFAKDHIKIMGLPKYDSIFINPPNKEDLKLKWNIPTDKKIIVYLPTWDEDRSIDLFEHAITQLKSNYVILTKSHNNIYKFNKYKPQQEKLDRMSTRIINSQISLAELALIADLLLTDVKSGATTEALYVTQGKTPWIGLTSLDLSEYCPDILAAGPVLNQPSQLKTIVEQILQNDPYTPQRIIVNQYYSGNPSGPGHAAQDGATAIIAFAHMQPLNQNYPYLWKKFQWSFEKRIHKIKTFFEKLT
jgi:hypothetical protein